MERAPTEVQERIVGRTKLSDIELDDTVKATSARNALTTIVEDGKEIKILRENMAFGRAGQGEFGTYFIGYARSPRTTEQMLQNMFVGRPPGNYDRLLDFSRAVTGGLVFRTFALVPRVHRPARSSPGLAQPADSQAKHWRSDSTSSAEPVQIGRGLRPCCRSAGAVRRPEATAIMKNFDQAKLGQDFVP